MDKFGTILIFLGLALIITMFFLDPADLVDRYVDSNTRALIKNRDVIGLLGITLSIMGAIFAAASDWSSDLDKRCTSCNEVINDKAKKCKHCLEWVEGEK